MKFTKKLIVMSAIALGAGAPTLSMAKYHGQDDLVFTFDEIQQHHRSIHEFVEVGKRCLEDYRDEQQEFYNSTCPTNLEGNRICVSKYFGNRKFTQEKDPTKRFRRDGAPLTYLKDGLRALRFSESTIDWLYGEMKSISCVDMALNCLYRSFDATGLSSVKNKLKDFVVHKNDGQGTAMQWALNQLGWTTFYWNPSTVANMETNAKSWDLQERVYREGCKENNKRNYVEWESRGQHWLFYAIARNNMRDNGIGRYLYNDVHNMEALVGFGEEIPRMMYDPKMKFWIGTAHGGYHVFPGSGTQVIEAHSMKALTDIRNIEFSDFNPMASGGGPRWGETREFYRSGIVVVPPVLSQIEIEDYSWMAKQYGNDEGITDFDRYLFRQAESKCDQAEFIRLQQERARILEQQRRQQQNQTNRNRNRGIFGGLFRNN